MYSFKYTFTKNQLDIFRAICTGNTSVNDIVKSINPSSSTIYRITEGLEVAKIIRSNDNKKVQFEPNNDLLTESLKRYVLSNDHPIEAIVGSKLLILLSISYISKSIIQIAKETKLKPETVRVLVWNLRRFGVVTQQGSKILISPTDLLMKQFLQDLSRGMNLRIMQDKTKVGNMLWSAGLECVFSTLSLVDSTEIQKTGISAMANHGLQFISKTKYCYYSYWHHELKAEDIAIHSLLIDPFGTRGISYSLLLLKKIGFDPKYLMREARRVGINKQVREMIGFLSGSEVSDPFFPSRADFDELSRQYEVQ